MFVGQNVTSACAVGVNPISRLIQIQQAKKEKQPQFTLVAENGVARSREFVFQVRLFFSGVRLVFMVVKWHHSSCCLPIYYVPCQLSEHSGMNLLNPGQVW